MPIDLPGFALLFGVGLLAGAINVVAGGGSFLTLPVLIFLGLPPGVANATNRVGILLQDLPAVWGFRRHGVLDGRALVWAALPATAGGVFGAWGALVVDDTTFRRLLAFLMVAISLWSFWAPQGRGAAASLEGRIGRRWPLFAGGFFLCGVYGGFVQAGVGFLILAVTTAAGLDLVRGNAVKALTALSFTILSLGIFAWQGRVVWSVGLCLGLGTAAGGLAGVYLTVLKGHAWVRGVVTAAVVAFAVKLWLGG